MEIIKFAKSGLALIFFLFLFNSQTFSQDFDALEKAFSESYELEKTGEYSQAVEKLKKFYTEGSYEINLRLGWLNYLLGNFTESSAYYERSISLSPYAIEARFGYVYPLSALGNWGIVKQQYEKILDIDPRNTLANYRMGMIFYGSEDYNTALKYFEKVVNLYPFDYDGTIMFAWTNFKLGKMREAEVLFRKALLMRPGDESANEGLQLVK
ncbi:MAG: tetratricopeptide repeat protein [Bacteroidales bacterium]|nr:tetratricopeptide repeat protein [Bacteroidales bacterium]